MMAEERKISFKLFIIIFVSTIFFMVVTFGGISFTIMSKSEAANVSTTTVKAAIISSTTTYDFKEYSSISPHEQPSVPLIGCPFEIAWVGDGSCDDQTNFELCFYDGGDCCLEPAIKDDYCNECICHLDDTRHPSKNSAESPEATTTHHLDSSLTITTTDVDTIAASTSDPYPNCEFHFESWIGDGICDDGTNSEDCNYDGGDCCLDFVVIDHCLDCCCHENGCLTSTTPFVNLCPSCNTYMLGYLGDMVCNDYFNTEECCFDLGDCCDPNADKLPSSCSECKCKSENGLASLLTPDTPLGPCQPESFISDGFCDDSLNFPICEFDGGDCCSSTSDYAFCSVCLCVSPANFTEPMAYSDKCQISWIGDGVCDDVNNNQGCIYDEDDCCGDKGQTQFDYCTICQCYEK